MRLIIGFILAAFVSSPAIAKDVKKAAHAKKPAAVKSAKKAAPAKGKFAKASTKKRGKFSYKLLNFQQVAKLPKAKRARYIKEMRELLVLIEGYQKRYEVASDGRLHRFKKQVASLLHDLSLLPEAHADMDSIVAAREAMLRQQEQARLDALARLSKVYPVFNGNEWICGPGLTFDKWAGTCLLNNTTGATNFDAAGTGQNLCPATLGFMEIPWTNGGAPGQSWVSTQRSCVPKGSYDRLGERQADVKNGKWLEQNFFETQSMEIQTAAVNAPAAVVTDPITVTPDPENPPTDVGAGDTENGEGETPDADTPDADTPATVACTPPVLKCDAVKDQTQIDAAISRFRSNGRKDDAICVSGAFLSKYKGGTKTPGGCDIVTKLPYAERFGENQPKCGAGGVMCNPVAFCMSNKKMLTVRGADGKPVLDASGNPTKAEKEIPLLFCVDKPSSTNKNSPITERCNTEYARMMDGKPWVDKAGQTHADQIVPGGAEMKGVVPKKCDAFDFKELPIQNEWNQMVTDTENLVKNWCANDKHDDLQVLFCRECQILSDKIWAMNSSVKAEANCATTVAEDGDKPDPVTAPPAEAVTEDEDLG